MLFLVSCADRQAVYLPPLAGTTEMPDCRKIYPQGRWQFVHSLEFSLADGKKGNAVGVTVIDDPVIECALMTVEGLVLFAARYDRGLKIKRAIPPFDNQEFAGGLIRDLQLIFFPPLSEDIQYGKNDNGTICRYRQSAGPWLDIILSTDQGWRLNQYGPDKIRNRSVTARPGPVARQWQPPEYLELTACDAAGYTLKMTLVSAEKL